MPERILKMTIILKIPTTATVKLAAQCLIFLIKIRIRLMSLVTFGKLNQGLANNYKKKLMKLMILSFTSSKRVINL